MEPKSPSSCRLCHIALADLNDWRQHAKSDWHIYNLRVRVAEPGIIVPQPSSSSSPKRVVEEMSKSYLDYESNDDNSEPSEGPKFNPGQCLFCGTKNDTFDDNVAHMLKKHGFAIPREDDLIVEPASLIGYLHLVIYRYGECILCGTYRSTVEGIQHHMTAKGHCRFNITSDIAEFYDIPVLDYHVNSELLRLPSGKLLSHRTRVSGTAAPKAARQITRRPAEAAELYLATSAHLPESVQMQDNNTTAPSIPRITRKDQQSLSHLPGHEIRSLLATSAGHMDQFKREEKHAQLKLDTAGNTTLTAHFRMDTSKRFRGPWG
ncbi:C2H2 type zinc-finger domain-containing protein [Trichoderma chlorosporum]